MGGIFESKSLTLTIWYKHPLEIILHAFKPEMIRPLGIEFPLFHSTTGSLGRLNLPTLVLQSMGAKQAWKQSILKIISKSTISSSTNST